MDTLKPCPFCNSSPVFPESKDVYGTFYDAGCDDCGIPTISIQIIDCFDHPRQHVHDSWNDETFQYGIEFIEVARQEAISAWNKRTSEWVSVEDRLPKEIIEFCLVTRNWGVEATMEANYADGKFMTYRFGALQEFKNPTHWMPLPLPPKGDE